MLYPLLKSHIAASITSIAKQRVPQMQTGSSSIIRLVNKEVVGLSYSLLAVVLLSLLVLLVVPVLVHGPRKEGAVIVPLARWQRRTVARMAVELAHLVHFPRKNA